MIKTFEKYQRKLTCKDYEVGDYVKLKFSPIFDKGIIISKSKSDYGSYFLFSIERIHGERDLFSIYQIERKLTQEEIEDYEVEKAAKKYNL